MTRTVLKTIKENNMLRKGSRVLCALSGGIDSTVLLHVLCALSKELEIEVCAAHLNHMLRGEESDRDEEFSKSLCEGLGVPFISERADILTAAKESGKSAELAARDVRYAFLRRAKEGFGANVIATAHNANDNLETVLFNLSRGGGADGVAGIPPVRGDIIRPLIGVTRREIEKYAKDNGISHVEDKTNAETVYSRNKLRHLAVPVLEEINSAAVANASRTSSAIRRDSEFISICAERAFNEMKLSETSCRAKELLALHPALRYRVCESFARNALSSELYSLEEKHAEAIFSLCENQCPSAVMNFPQGLTVSREYEKLVFSKNEIRPLPEETQLSEGVNKFGEYLIHISECESRRNKSGSLFIAKSKICGKLTVRSRKPGDEIKLPRRPEKSLKKLMIEAKIPEKERAYIPVIADASGVVAVLGIGVNEPYAAEDEKYIKIKTEKGL